MRLFNYLLAGCLVTVGAVAQAAPVPGLYQVREAVEGQGAEARTAATGKALQTLVLRLTGDPKAAQGAALAALRKDPQRIISQFGYEAGPPETLVVEFDPGSTERALRQAGLALWGSNRPSIVGWWLDETVEGSHLVGDGQAEANVLRRAAQHRGLPLRLPLADLQEQLIADGAQLDSPAPDALRDASQRYATDAVLAVHARQGESGWQAGWQLWLGDTHEQGRAEGADPASLADAVMRAVSLRLAPRFVIRPGSRSDLQVQVEGMNLPRYAELGRVLEPYGAQLRQVEGQTLTYAVSGSPDQVRAQLGLAKLRELPADPPAPAPQPGAIPGEPAAPTAQPFDGLRFGW
ncbi:DUF2066 domain-containing protein [Pseudomonas entomophila]|uniref:DUF2066 domain-containing protein n=1 Tax=Pseudomonas entomophila TaxID=312306 RepID=UPI003EBF7CFB